MNSTYLIYGRSGDTNISQSRSDIFKSNQGCTCKQQMTAHNDLTFDNTTCGKY